MVTNMDTSKKRREKMLAREWQKRRAVGNIRIHQIGPDAKSGKSIAAEKENENVRTRAIDMIGRISAMVMVIATGTQAKRRTKRETNTKIGIAIEVNGGGVEMEIRRRRSTGGKKDT